MPYKPKELIRVSEFKLAGNEHKHVLDCLTSRWLTQGKYVKQLEERFAELAGVKYAVACSSGTAALHLALLAAGVLSSDTVFVPSLSYVATVNAVKYCGASPKFIDVDISSWCIDYEKCYQGTLEVDPFVVLTVDLYDACGSDFKTWDETTIIRDSAHSFKHQPRDGMSCHSFYGSKIVGCGEGGMLATNNEEYHNLACLYRGQGATTPGEYHHSVIGYNYRMTDLQAGVALAQLEDLPNTLAYRRHLIDRYRSNLANSPITLQGGERASGWMMAVLLPEGHGHSVKSVRDNLLSANIETRPFFVPLCDTEAYKFLGKAGSCPIAANLYNRGICLPTHLGLDDEDVDYICEKLLEEVTTL